MVERSARRGSCRSAELGSSDTRKGRGAPAGLTPAEREVGALPHQPKIDWAKPLRTQHAAPREAILDRRNPCTMSGRYRVEVAGDYGGERWRTMFLYDAHDHVRCDGRPSMFDLSNA